jgi:hypothetical protein
MKSQEKGIIEFGLEGAVSVAVDDVEVGNGHAILRGLERPVNWVKTGFVGVWGWNVLYLRWSWWSTS